jgi:hypothetical protein
MPTTASPLRLWVQIEAAIVKAETQLTLALERLEGRKAAGRDCTVAEALAHSVQMRLASLHLRRDAVPGLELDPVGVGIGAICCPAWRRQRIASSRLQIAARTSHFLIEQHYYNVIHELTNAT